MKAFSISVLLSLLFGGQAWAQFAPALGFPGNIAMYKDSAAFVAWATGIVLERGPMQIGVDSLGDAWVGNEEEGIGKAGSNGVVCLGDGGKATATFDTPISNGPGYDFAVFENSFDGQFLELAFVEVSSDGVHFVRFPCFSDSDTLPGTGSFGYTQPEKIHNLAGKYPVFYGTPFDLQELWGTPGLDIDRITHVRVVDVIGTMVSDWASKDVRGRKIADPWPTPFPSGGFDLDAIGVIHSAPALVQGAENLNWKVFPQPATDAFFVRNDALLTNTLDYTLYELSGRKIQSGELLSNGRVPVDMISAGVYLLKLAWADGSYTTRICIGK